MSSVDDVSFYNLLGEEISRGYILEQMIRFYKLLLDVGETRVTDFNEGSEIRNLLEIFALVGYIILESENDLTEIGFIDSSYGEWLDMHGRNPFIKLERDTGSEASGYVTFSVSDPVLSDTTVPEGTLVLNSETGLEYTTLNDAILSVGDSSVEVAIECLTTGEDGNCGKNKIDTISELISDIDTLTVTNEEEITGGTDYEEDEEYRQRLLDYIRQDDFGSLPYYIRLGSTVDGVHDINIVEDSNDEYTMIVVVNGNVKPTPDEVLAEVLSVFTDTNNLVIEHHFTVEKPTYVTVNLNIGLNVSETIESELVTTILSDFFDGGDNIGYGLEYDGLYMGDDLTREMIDNTLTLLENVEEVNSIKINSEVTEFENLTVDDTEVVKLGTVTVNQTIIEG